jgi:hypothetical protein
MDSESYHLLSDIVKDIGAAIGEWPVVVFVRPQTEVGDDILGYILNSAQRAGSSFLLSLVTTNLRPELGFRIVDHLKRLRPHFDFVVNGPCFGGANLVPCGADSVYFTQTGEMGLWWGSVNTPWNPVDENHHYLPLDVDLFLGYLEILREYPQAVEPITKDVSPLAVSAAYNTFKRTLRSLEAMKSISGVKQGALQKIVEAIEEDYARASLPWGPDVLASFGFNVIPLEARLESGFNEINTKVFTEGLVPQRQGSADNYNITVPDVIIVDPAAVLLHTTYIEGVVVDTEIDERPVGAEWRTVYYRG